MSFNSPKAQTPRRDHGNYTPEGLYKRIDYRVRKRTSWTGLPSRSPGSPVPPSPGPYDSPLLSPRTRDRSSTSSTTYTDSDLAVESCRRILDKIRWTHPRRDESAGRDIAQLSIAIEQLITDNQSLKRERELMEESLGSKDKRIRDLETNMNEIQVSLSTANEKLEKQLTSLRDRLGSIKAPRLFSRLPHREVKVEETPSLPQVEAK